MASKAFFEAVKARRSIYPLSKESPIPDSRIREIIEAAVKHAPSSFNSQTSRVLILFGAEHDKLWDITTEAVKVVAPPEAFEKQTKPKLDGFKGAHGTAVFFEDRARVQEFQNKFSIYADRFPQWSEHTHGMAAYISWTGLELEGLGCNLQHYNPLIDQQVLREWSLPDTWEVRAQLVFGKPKSEPAEKTFQPIEDRVKVFGQA